MLAIIFDSVGAGEWLVLLAVLLVVMGPKRLPSTARKIGSYYSKFRRAADSFKRQLMDMDLEMGREFNKVESEVADAVKIPDITDPSASSDVPDESGFDPEHGYDETGYDETGYDNYGAGEGPGYDEPGDSAPGAAPSESDVAAAPTAPAPDAAADAASPTPTDTPHGD